MEGVRGGKRNKWLDFGNNPDDDADCSVRNPAITQQIINLDFGEIFRIALQWCKE